LVPVAVLPKYQFFCFRKSTADLAPREEEEEEEFFNYYIDYKNDLKRHAHTPSGVAGADLKS
jgi:hypothetical protein